MLIGGEQHGSFAAGQGQIEAVVDGVIEMSGQGQRLCLQVTDGFDHIHLLGSPAQAPMQPISLQLARALRCHS